MRLVALNILALIVIQSWWVRPASAEFSVPRLTGPVVDQVGLLSGGDERLIAQTLTDLNNQGIMQLQVLIVAELSDTPIEQAAYKVVDTWKLGTKDKDNGALIMVAIKERKMRIEIGRGLEGDIPDVIAKRIVSDVISPLFKRKSYAEGLMAGISAMAQIVAPNFVVANPNFSSHQRSKSSERELSGFEIIVLIVFLLIFAVGRMFGFGGRHRGGFLGGGGGGFGGGGGWSGGGGGFSGGGASGDW